MGTNLSQVTEEQIEAAWQSVMEEVKRGELRPGEKTRAMFVKETGVSPSTASRLLGDRTKFTRRAVTVNGRASVAYTPIVIE